MLGFHCCEREVVLGILSPAERASVGLTALRETNGAVAGPPIFHIVWYIIKRVQVQSQHHFVPVGFVLSAAETPPPQA